MESLKKSILKKIGDVIEHSRNPEHRLVSNPFRSLRFEFHAARQEEYHRMVFTSIRDAKSGAPKSTRGQVDDGHEKTDGTIDELRVARARNAFKRGHVYTERDQLESARNRGRARIQAIL